MSNAQPSFFESPQSPRFPLSPANSPTLFGSESNLEKSPSPPSFSRKTFLNNVKKNDKKKKFYISIFLYFFFKGFGKRNIGNSKTNSRNKTTKNKKRWIKNPISRTWNSKNPKRELSKETSGKNEI